MTIHYFSMNDAIQYLYKYIQGKAIDPYTAWLQKCCNYVYSVSKKLHIHVAQMIIQVISQVVN